MANTEDSIAACLRQLNLQVLERGWLSSNNIVFRAAGGHAATVVDTGYDSHSNQTAELVRRSLGGAPLERVVNTHLHSDHCGGNSALQAAWGCEAWVPSVSFDAVRQWDETRLTYQATGQTCQRFEVHEGLAPGSKVGLGGCTWDVLAAPGHDPDALMFFQVDSGVLISGDALWEQRLAIIFPELTGQSGFSATRQVLETIEALEPKIVVPGHGRAFGDVPAAIAASRRRLDHFEAVPAKHMIHAARSLAMFHMLEMRQRDFDGLVQWMSKTAIFAGLVTNSSERACRDSSVTATSVVERLIADGLLQRDRNQVSIQARPEMAKGPDSLESGPF